MAYALEIFRHDCRWCFGPKRATHEVKNRRNETVGYGCKKHAEAEAKRLSEVEQGG